MRLVIAGGGTGGHVYPALVVVEALLEPEADGSPRPILEPDDVLWIGSRGGIEEEMVRRSAIEFVGLAAGGLRGMGLLVKARNALRIVGSVRKARKVLSEFRPDVVLVTGGYACVSVALAARVLRIPVLIYLPDIVPGMAIRFLSRIARRVAATSEESRHHLDREKLVVTGYPVRSKVFRLERDQARVFLQLDMDLPVVLVFGGSRGARSINRALVAGLRQLLPVCQVVHVSGRLDADWVEAAARQLPEELQARYRHYAYLHDMPEALVAADLAVARAGASTMGEFPAACLPAVLVPYPFSGQHQQANADYMARNGGARVLQDADLPTDLVPTILDMLADPEELASMRESAKAMAREDAAETIARQLWLVAREKASGQAGTEP